MSLNKNERTNIDNQLNQLYECKSLSESDVKFITDKVILFYLNSLKKY